MKPFAYAEINGSDAFPNLSGVAAFFKNISKGIWIKIEVTGLPDENSPAYSSFYGLHIHEYGDCTPPFDKTGEHYNPNQAPHPNHAGDLPPLLGNHGYAYASFFTDRLTPADIIDKSLIIHSNPDDFTSQPSGNSGIKIACGVIKKCDGSNDLCS